MFSKMLDGRGLRKGHEFGPSKFQIPVQEEMFKRFGLLHLKFKPEGEGRHVNSSEESEHSCLS